MSHEEIPGWFVRIKREFPDFFNAVEGLGKAVRQDGPLDEKTGHLVQLAAAAASRSEGAVHSHVRRALEAGATREEVFHTLILLTSTIGFPPVSAALRWAADIIEREE